MLKLSERLLAAAALVTEGKRLADVGTDHGYIPIYLLEQKKILSAIAMDINAGPLERAKEHIALYGMGDYIQTRLSDGVAALTQGEADTILVAGMGGGLVMHILEDGKEICKTASELVLQPQSELERVRQYLVTEGYETLEEDMILEEDKFYPMMKVRYVTPEQTKEAFERLSDTEKRLYCIYGGKLLQKQHPVLKLYLEKEEMQYRKIYENLQKQPASEKITKRIQEVEQILKNNREALCFFRSVPKL